MPESPNTAFSQSTTLAPIFPWGAAIFCRVVDNMGDAGVCWRLAKHLSALGLPALLIIDEPEVLARMLPELEAHDTLKGIVSVEGEGAPVGVVHWSLIEERANARELSIIGGRWPRLVLETFGCRLPESVEEGLNDGLTRLWMNLEYLSAEDYAEDCHGVWGAHPRLPLKKLWFYPGFTPKTGGLLFSAEDELRTAPERLRSHRAEWLTRLGANPEKKVLFVFTYPSYPLGMLARALTSLPESITVLLAPGAAGETLKALLGESQHEVISLPYLSQDDFDEVIWENDLAIIRGEESFVRAQLGATPFLWSIYPTEDYAHEVKLDAWLSRLECIAQSPEEKAAFQLLSRVTRDWVRPVVLEGAEKEKQRYAREASEIKESEAFTRDFLALWEALPQVKSLSRAWREELLAHGDLASAILRALEAQTGTISRTEV